MAALLPGAASWHQALASERVCCSRLHSPPQAINLPLSPARPPAAGASEPAFTWGCDGAWALRRSEGAGAAARRDSHVLCQGLRGDGGWTPAASSQDTGSCGPRGEPEPELRWHWEDDLAGCRVVVVGLGASGRAAAALALARGAAEVVAMDSNESLTPLEGDKAWLEECRSRWHIDLAAAEGEPLPSSQPQRLRTLLGTPHDETILASASVIVLSPGVPPGLPCFHMAKAEGVRMVSELAFAFEALPPDVPVAAVSGTNGKSTVTTFTGQILEANGVHPVFVGGNLGTPLSYAALHSLASSRERPSPVSGPPSPGMAAPKVPWKAIVAEVSSYQMELPGAFRPKAAVVLNLTMDHMERHGSMGAYGAAKCNLFRAMGPGQVAILPAGDSLLRGLALQSGGDPTWAWLGSLPGVQVNSDYTTAQVQVPEGPPAGVGGAPGGVVREVPLGSLRLVGRHNVDNAMAALLLALCLGVVPGSDPTHFWNSLPATLARLSPPPHRMQLVAVDGGGVAWVNDSKATNLESTAAGLRGLSLPLPGQHPVPSRSSLHLTGALGSSLHEPGIGGKEPGEGMGPRAAEGEGATAMERCRAVVLLGGVAKKKPTGSSSGAPSGPQEGSHSGAARPSLLGFEVLAPLLADHRAVIAFGESGEQIALELEQVLEQASVGVWRCATFLEAVKKGRELCRPGDCLLLSPACASFDEFKNFEHRGHTFAGLAAAHDASSAGLQTTTGATRL